MSVGFVVISGDIEVCGLRSALNSDLFSLTTLLRHYGGVAQAAPFGGNFGAKETAASLNE